MFSRCWDILLVDDEPDVLSVSRLALKGLTVYGLPLRLHEARSKADAIELMHTHLSSGASGVSPIAAAFIDVVMETDRAGLDLCRYMREEMKNRTTQLYVRTGQPGIAPERSVVDRYEINGYTLKIDATPDRLYMLVKSGVRQYYATAMARLYGDLLQELIPVSGSREHMRSVLDGFTARLQRGADGRRLEAMDLRMSILAGDEVIAGNWHADPACVLAQRDRLSVENGIPMGRDRYVVSGNDVLIQIAEGPMTSDMCLVSTATSAPPHLWLELLHGHVRALAALWKKAPYVTRIRQDADVNAWIAAYDD